MPQFEKLSGDDLPNRFRITDGTKTTIANIGSDLFYELEQKAANGDIEVVLVDDTPVPTVDELRIAAYGPIGDQLDEIYWDQVNGTTNWKDHVAAVKAANPK
jgi:hypothetical protein